MGWMGKVIGGAMGFAFGGPLGMIAGIAFGNLFDRASQYTSTQEQSIPFGAGTTASMDPQQQSQMIFFVGAFSMLARIATVDGRLLPEEQRKVEEFINHDLKLDAQGRQAALRVFNAALTGGGTFDQFATQFYQNFAHEPSILELMIDVLVRVAVADGVISEAEDRLITVAARIFRIPDALLVSIRRRYGLHGGTSPVKAYAVLGLQQDATPEEVKKAYRKLSREFHPDSIASKGLPEEFTKFAEEKFRAIQEAYDTIRKEKGFG